MNLIIIYKIFLFILITNNITSWRHTFNKKHKINMLSNDRDKDKDIKQCIISCKNDNYYCNNERETFLKENEFLKNKRLITISPGGFKGFYLLGILSFIKENYDLDDFIFSGASAGSWNSLFMCYKGSTLDFVYSILDYNIKKRRSITELEYFLKYRLLSLYKDEDFDLRRLFIGVTALKKFGVCTNIFSDFENLEDAINCCIASSHIPLVTGSLTNKYHNMFTFDGGFSNYPYLINDKDKHVLHVTPSMWEEMSKKNKNTNIKSKIRTIKDFSEIFSISKNNLLELFDDGYQDAKKHKKILDTIFRPKLKPVQQQEQQTDLDIGEGVDLEK